MYAPIAAYSRELPGSPLGKALATPVPTAPTMRSSEAVRGYTWAWRLAIPNRAQPRSALRTRTRSHTSGWLLIAEPPVYRLSFLGFYYLARPRAYVNQLRIDQHSDV
jgi:hypothetical protein